MKEPYYVIGFLLILYLPTLYLHVNILYLHKILFTGNIYKLKVYDMIIRHMYILQNDYDNKIS